ncbi:MAG: exodeoxyribonuclease VII large subunit [Deltaproteobacteria bacterium]|jgi:exodeoxyribonuclease VII large subunit|nr:exodeoxyribonuclease VII large subunit [Deltaproteobacteria bacterium]
MLEQQPPFFEPNDSIKRRIYSVSELNANIKALLEDNFPFVWLCGEISNFRIPASGHYYFSLKDAASQISAVMFRGQQRKLKFEPEDGMSVTGMGRISVYEPRGVYQIILEYLEPSGIGALQIAFEQLKNRLAGEGLFKEEHKTKLPYIPNKIGVITSRSGAVVHDILQVLNRRFPNVPVQILPVKVQGQGAVEEIVAALDALNRLGECDVALLARGGGSLEDLQAFNSEPIARAIFASRVPIISAVGHETDFTIADFVADLRAPTPSAAAELVVPEKSVLQRRCREVENRLRIKIINYFSLLYTKIREMSHRLVDPRRKIEDLRLRIDDYDSRLSRNFAYRLRSDRQQLEFHKQRLNANNPRFLVNKIKEKLDKYYNNLIKSYIILNNFNQVKIRALTAKLEALSPVAILSRGYSITRTIPDGRVVKDPREIALNQDLDVRVAKGRLFCRVKGKTTNGQKDI